MKITNIYKKTAALFFLMAAALWPAVDAWGQVKGDMYNNDKKDYIINHKRAKWYDQRKTLITNNEADNFDDDESLAMNTGFDDETKIQAAHTLIDTIYVHRGTSVTLTLPDYIKTTTNNKTYQRWYDYRTDGTFETSDDKYPTEYSNGIHDLLTPGTPKSGTAANGVGYRFANGYVGQPVSSACLYVMDFYVPESETQNWYLVGCDVSGYKDYTETFTSDSKNSKFGQNGKYWEPTLSHRFIYYIRVIDDETSWAAKQLKAGKPIEEKDITMPATRLPDYTNEMVALSMDARSYLTPGGADEEAEGDLTVSLEANTNTAGISLCDKNRNAKNVESLSLSGEDRVIFISYPNKNQDYTQSVNTPADGSDPKATVNVYRGTTLVARYNLTFKEESRLLTQTQVSQENENDDSDYRYRMPDYLNENYELLTELNFDFDENVAELYGQEQCYPFPLGWNSSTYGFYDGGVAAGDFTQASSKCPEWGYYGILNSYVECKDKFGENWGWTGYTYTAPNDSDPVRFNSKGNKSTFHLFADVSDRPGVIARLPFDRKLCPGTELFVTAWVKCARGANNANNPAALFTIMGVKSRNVETSSTKDYTPIYRFQTGQIPVTYRNDGGLAGQIPGFVEQTTGSTGGNNDWLQVYFSFINTNSDDFESYVLQIDNNSASTEGGDIYIDDIRVYVMSPNAKVTQLEATCTNDRTLTNFKLNWNQLMSRLGYDENSTITEDAIEFCFIDKIKYYNYLAEANHATDYVGAIQESVIEVGDNEESGSDYHKLYFKIPFDDNMSYNESASPRLASDNIAEGKEYFYGYTDKAGLKSLSVDFYSDLTPNRPYILLINHNAGDESLDASDFNYNIDDACTIKTEFYVTAQNLIRVNGEVVDPSTDFCAGQVFNFSPNLRVPTGVNEEDGTTIYTEIKEGVYFDWFFGTEEEFIAANSTSGNVSLQSALTKFREIFPEKENLEGVTEDNYTLPDGTSITLTQDDIDIINNYLNDTGAPDGIHNRLVLHKENLDIMLLESGLQLVVQPIQTLKSPDGTISDDDWTKICWNYVPLVLTTSGNAPKLQPGFNALMYPVDFTPSLRIGLKQIKSVSGDQTTEEGLTVVLRNAEYISENVDHLGPLTSLPNMNYLFLIKSDDPLLENYLNEENGFTQYALPVGWINSLHAEKYESGSAYDDNMEIRFDLNGDIFEGLNESTDFKFNPREGYSYTFAIPFEEKLDNNLSSSNACFGQFNLTMKVVPEYLVWNDSQTKEAGETIGNWNNDENWQRIESGRINATLISDGSDTENTDYFRDGGKNNNESGFVPMRFTKVIMPVNSKVELYAAGYTESGTQWASNRPDHIAVPSENIQYDLMAYESGEPLRTERYRVSLLDEIHFEPGAEMLHAEYLLYNKAWVDYQLGKGRWYTLASPLKAVYAGDFYTDKSGTEGSEYFKDITFNTTDNSRFSPSVYQRAWKGSAAMMVIGNNQNNEERAIAGNWSALYNDVAEAYTPGTGFSLKVQDVTNNATFRLPKADGSYDYYSQNGVVGGVSSGTINRDNAHRLKSDELYERNIDINAQGQKKDPIKIILSETAHGGYYLVGNPFMAHLNMSAFFDEDNGNGKVLQKKVLGGR